MKKILALLLVLSASGCAVSEPAWARFDCGRVALRLTHSNCGSPLALLWAKNCAHTHAHPGAVVVQRRKGRALGGGAGGHVSRIEHVISQCRAVVTDDKGTYERDICKNLVAYVQP